MRNAVLLIAHGSRRTAANDELHQLADSIRARLPETFVATAFLELAQPTIPAGIEACLASGAKRVRLFPYFLSPGMHVTRDLEAFRTDYAARRPDVEFMLCEPLGSHPRMTELVLERLLDADRPQQAAHADGASGGAQSE